MRQSNSNRKMVYLYAAVFYDNNGKLCLYDRKDNTFFHLVYKKQNLTYVDGANCHLSDDEKREISLKSERFINKDKDIIEIPKISLIKKKNFISKIEKLGILPFFTKMIIKIDQSFWIHMDIKKYVFNEDVRIKYDLELYSFVSEFIDTFLDKENIDFDSTVYLI